MSNRHSRISKAKNPCTRPRATLPSVSMRRFAICVAGRRVSPCRIVKVALVQCNLEDLNIHFNFAFFPLALVTAIQTGLNGFVASSNLTLPRWKVILAFGLYSLLPRRVVRKVLVQHGDSSTRTIAFSCTHFLIAANLLLKSNAVASFLRPTWGRPDSWRSDLAINDATPLIYTTQTVEFDTAQVSTFVTA